MDQLAHLDGVSIGISLTAIDHEKSHTITAQSISTAPLATTPLDQAQSSLLGISIPQADFHIARGVAAQDSGMMTWHPLTGASGTALSDALLPPLGTSEAAKLAALGAASPGSHMTIVVQDAPGVTLSAAAQNALNYAATYLGDIIADPIAVTIQANISNLNAVTKTNVLAYGFPEAYYVPYFIAQGELAQHDPALAAYLPATDKAAGGVQAVVSKSELQAWGLPTQNYYAVGGSIVINTYFQKYFNYSTNNALQAAGGNSLDFVGLALHELSHALGRVRFDQSKAGTATGQYAGDPLAGLMDLTAFTAPGTLQHTATAGVGPDPYFSLNGGKTPIVYSATSTRTDWNNTMQNSAFLHDAWSGYLYPGLATMSAVDVTLLNALGFDLVCFAAGTKILTNTGPVAVEHLAEGDDIVLHRGGTAPIKWIGHRHVDASKHPKPETVWPVLIEAGAILDGVPHRDLLVSPNHAFLLDGHLIPAKTLINGSTIRQVERKHITYYHIELPEHAVLYAEGTPTESYLDTGNRNFFENAGIAVSLHPDFSTTASAQQDRAQQSCAPFIESGPLVEAIRARILARAAIATTDDPAILIHKQTDGSVILHSRHAIPGYLSPDPRDRRTLGVKILSLHAGPREIPLDHPLLVEGWHSPEPDGRWTNGRAIIPAALVAGCDITIDIAGSLAYPVASKPAKKLSSGARR